MKVVRPFFSERLAEPDRKPSRVLSKAEIYAQIDVVLEFHSQPDSVVWKDVFPFEFFQGREHCACSHPCYAAESGYDVLPEFELDADLRCIYISSGVIASHSACYASQLFAERPGSISAVELCVKVSGQKSALPYLSFSNSYT